MRQDRDFRRLESAISGDAVHPPVRGLSFVAPLLLPGAGQAARRPAVALARACVDLHLDFAFVPTWEVWCLEAVRLLSEAGVLPLAVVPGVAWPALEALGVEAGLRAAVLAPADLAGAMDRALERATAAAREVLDAGAAGLVVADDMAGGDGPLLPLDALENVAMPRLATLATLARGAGIPVLLHCDGDARALFGAIRSAGFTAVHGDHGGSAAFERSLAAARETGIALIGGISTASLTSPTQGALAGSRAATHAAAGGLLVCDDGGVTTGDEVVALFAALGAAARG